MIIYRAEKENGYLYHLMVVRLSFSYSLDKKTEVIRIPQCYYYNYYKDLFTHKDINTYINGVVKICLNKFFFFLKTQVMFIVELFYSKCNNNNFSCLAKPF